MTESSLASVFFWLAVLCCAIAQVAITRSAIRGRRIPENVSAAAPRRRRRRLGDVAWTLIPAVGLAFVLLVTWHAIHQPQFPPFMPPGAMSGMGHAAAMR